MAGQGYPYSVDLTQENSSHTQLILLTGIAKKVLEVGSATGYMTAVLRERGCRVTAIEKDPAAAQIAARFCERMIVGDVETLDFTTAFAGERFDVVIFGDVLEHLVNLHDVLTKAATVLQPDGYVVASIPNVAHGSIRLALLYGQFPYTEQGLLDKTPIRFFTREGIARLFHEAGYTIETWRRIIVDPFATELALKETDYPPYLVAALRHEPDALTYQFVVKAYPSTASSGPKAEDEGTGTVPHRERPLPELWDLSEHVALLEQQLADRETLLARQEVALRELRLAFTALQASLSYRLLEATWRFMRWLFPPGSWRGAPFWALVRMMRAVLLTPDGAFDVSRSGRLLRLASHAWYIRRTEGWRALARYGTRRLALALRRGARPARAEFVREYKPLTLPAVDQPTVSIIIPVYNKSLYTYNCLFSLAQNTDRVPYEVIVVDDASSDDTAAMLQQIENVRVVRNAENAGFTRSCNAGAAVASGRYLLFLNNDTQVRKGWLSALVGLAEQDELVGLVGAKLLYPGGKLQEAGGIVWSDGSGWNYGRLDDPAKPEYNYVREVDYCSGACLLVRRDLFERAGGFDLRYAPAYYEDTDLAFTLRQMGYKVLYQPRAEVVHFEGISHGTDTTSGLKRFQEINRVKFVAKWQQVLQEHHLPNGGQVLIARDRRSKRALVVDNHVPMYDHDSGSLRMYSLLKILTELGFAITFVPDNMARLEPYTGALQQLGIEVLYGRMNVAGHIRRLGEHLDLCIVSRPEPARTYVPIIRKVAPSAALLYDTVDLHFLRESRRAEVEKSEAARREAERYRQIELGLARICDAVITVTEAEKRLLERELPGIRVHVIPNIHEVRQGARPLSERRDLLFVGSYQHPPNRDAVTYFLRDIWPLIKKEIPDVKFFVVGSHVTKEIKALASSDVIVTGWVQDVVPYFERCRVFVAPLRYGSGLKGKIGQSMGCGLPVVMTSIGAEGMDVVDGREALIADDPAEFAHKVVRLYRDEQLWTRIAAYAGKYVEEHYSPPVVQDKLRTLLAVVMHGQRFAAPATELA